MLSGTSSEGGMLRNLPNALPWLAVLICVAVAFRWPRLGGAMVLALGLYSVVFFHAWASPVVLFGVSLPLIVLAALVVIAAQLCAREAD